MEYQQPQKQSTDGASSSGTQLTLQDFGSNSEVQDQLSLFRGTLKVHLISLIEESSMLSFEEDRWKKEYEHIAPEGDWDEFTTAVMGDGDIVRLISPEETSPDEGLVDRLKDNAFRVSASLELYEGAFGGGFQQDVGTLGEDQRWLDGGAGTGRAMRDLHSKKEGKTPNMVALGYEKPDDEGLRDFEEKESDKFRYVSGKFFGDCGDEELGTEPYDVISDFNGVLLYTSDLSGDLQKYLDRMKVGGRLYIANLGTTTIELEEAEKSAVEWLGEVSGVSVQKSGDGLLVTKTDEVTSVPPLTLTSSNYKESPPIRVFGRK